MGLELEGDGEGSNGGGGGDGGKARPEWWPLVPDDGLRLVLLTFEETAHVDRRNAAEARKADMAVFAAAQGRLAELVTGEALQTRTALSDALGVANVVYGELRTLRSAVESQAEFAKRVGAHVGIDAASSVMPPPMRVRLDSLSSEIEAAKAADAEIRRRADAAEKTARSALLWNRRSARSMAKLTAAVTLLTGAVVALTALARHVWDSTGAAPAAPQPPTTEIHR